MLKRVQIMILENELKNNLTVEQINAKLSRLNRNHNLMLFFLFLSKFVYIICSFTFNVVYLFNDNEETKEAHLISKFILTAIIILGNMFTMYLYIYFYRMGMRLMNLLKVFNHKNSTWRIKLLVHVMLFWSLW